MKKALNRVRIRCNKRPAVWEVQTRRVVNVVAVTVVGNLRVAKQVVQAVVGPLDQDHHKHPRQVHRSRCPRPLKLSFLLERKKKIAVACVVLRMRWRCNDANVFQCVSELLEMDYI
jgi:hypothetical protein